jgi:hypothetical protein
VSGERRRAPSSSSGHPRDRTRIGGQSDVAGCAVITGRYSQLEGHDGRDLVDRAARPWLFGMLGALRGMRRHQAGDTEVRALIPTEALERVAWTAKAPRPRTLAPEDAGPRGFKPGLQQASGRSPR